MCLLLLLVLKNGMYKRFISPKTLESLLRVDEETVVTISANTYISLKCYFSSLPYTFVSYWNYLKSQRIAYVFTKILTYYIINETFITEIKFPIRHVSQIMTLHYDVTA